jgi:hypothetical protein
MNLPWPVVAVAVVLSGCAQAPDAIEGPAPDDPTPGVPKTWSPEELLAAALGLPPPTAEEDEAEEVFREAAPWALEPREPQPTQTTSVATRHDTFRIATPDVSAVVVSSSSRSAAVEGPVHGVEGLLAWTGAPGDEWVLCALLDGQRIPEVPCAEGPSPLHFVWQAEVDSSLPAGVYGLRVYPAGEASVAYDLEARLDVHWTRLV